MARRKSYSSTGQATPQNQILSSKPPGSSNIGVEEFIAVSETIPYQKKSIFPSEMFLFYTLARELECTHVIESGGRVGGSTSYLSALFDSVDSVCSDPCDLPNVTTHSGDGSVLVPALIRQSDAENIAVLIDGPKDEIAVNLAVEALRDPRVKFVAVHDLSPDHASAGGFHSHDPSFRADAGILDKNVGEYLEKYPHGPGLTIFGHDHGI